MKIVATQPDVPKARCEARRADAIGGVCGGPPPGNFEKMEHFGGIWCILGTKRQL